MVFTGPIYFNVGSLNRWQMLCPLEFKIIIFLLRQIAFVWIITRFTATFSPNHHQPPLVFGITRKVLLGVNLVNLGLVHNFCGGNPARAVLRRIVRSQNRRLGAAEFDSEAVILIWTLCYRSRMLVTDLTWLISGCYFYFFFPILLRAGT